MVGSHRAKGPARSYGMRPAVLVALVVVAVVALIVTLLVLTQRGTDSPTSTPGTAESSPGESSAPATVPEEPTASPTTPEPTAAPSATARPKPKLPKVEPNPPRRLIIEGVLDTGFNNSIEPTGGELLAPAGSRPARWESRGLPGSPGTDTVVIVGRMSSGAAFSDLASVTRGTTITVRTNRGDLVYTVGSKTRLASDQLLDDDLITARTPGRLVLVGNAYDDSGNRADRDLVVIADLTGVPTS